MHVMAPCLRRRCSHTYKPKNWLDFLRKLVLVSIQICLFTGHLVLTVFSVWSVSHSGAHIITTRRHFSHSRIPKVHMNFSCDPLATSVCACVCVCLDPTCSSIAGEQVWSSRSVWRVGVMSTAWSSSTSSLDGSGPRVTTCFTASSSSCRCDQGNPTVLFCYTAREQEHYYQGYRKGFFNKQLFQTRLKSSNWTLHFPENK